MKKLLLLFFTLFLFSNFLTAQELIWSSEQKKSRSNLSYRANLFLTEDSEGFFMQKSRNGSALFREKIGWDLTPIKKIEFTPTKEKLTYKGVRKSHCFFFDHNGQTYALFKAKDIENEIYYYFIEKYDIVTTKLTFERELLVIDYGKTPTGHFDLEFYFSPDKKKLLAIYCPKHEDKTIRHYTLTLFDENFNQSWKETIKLPDNEKYKFYDENEILLSNNGDIFIFSDFDNEKVQKYIHKSRKKVFPRWDCQIIGIYNKGKTIKFYDIAEKEGLGINRSEALLTEEGDFILTSFYFDQKALNKENILGNYHLKINAQTQEVAAETFSPFSTQDFKIVLNTTFEEEEFSGKDQSNYHINVGNVYSGEHFLTKDGTLYRTIRYYESWYSGDREVNKVKHLYLFKILPNGKVEWIRKMPLFGKSMTALHVTDKKCYVLFNDHSKNIDLEINKFPTKVPIKKTMKKGCLIMISFAKNGQAKREVIQSYEENFTGGVDEIIDVKKNPNHLLLFATDNKEKSTYIGLLKLE